MIVSFNKFLIWVVELNVPPVCPQTSRRQCIFIVIILMNEINIVKHILAIIILIQLYNLEIIIKLKQNEMGPWCKRLTSRIPLWGPEFASRSLHVGFVVGETESGWVFLGVSPVFSSHKFQPPFRHTHLFHPPL